MIRVTEADAKSPIVRVGMYFLAALMFVSVPVIAWVTFDQFRRAEASERWPQVEGIIEASWVDENKIQGTYVPNVEYVYVVGNKTLIGKRIGQHQVECESRKDAEAMIAPYFVKSRHAVYYDPNAPADAMLEPGVTFGNYGMFAVPPVILLIGCVAWWLARRPLATAPTSEHFHGETNS